MSARSFRAKRPGRVSKPANVRDPGFSCDMIVESRSSLIVRHVSLYCWRWLYIWLFEGGIPLETLRRVSGVESTRRQIRPYHTAKLTRVNSTRLRLFWRRRHLTLRQNSWPYPTAVFNRVVRRGVRKTWRRQKFNKLNFSSTWRVEEYSPWYFSKEYFHFWSSKSIC